MTMHRHALTVLAHIFLIALLYFISGCTLKASTESLTDATTNFSSSTTPGAWFTVDGLLNPSERVNAFVTMNFENLRHDMAQGNGEYLAAFGALLDIPKDQVASFNLQAQKRFTQIYDSDLASAQSFINIVSEIK